MRLTIIVAGLLAFASSPARADVDEDSELWINVGAIGTISDRLLGSADIVARFRKVEDDYRALSRELSLEEWQQRSPWQRYLDNTMRLTAALQ